MAYNADELFKQAKELIKDKNLVFVDEVISYLPCQKTTFYKYFTDGSDYMEEIKLLLEDNKVATKRALRKRWSVSNNPTLQLALYRLLSTPEEHRQLNQNYTDITSKNEKIDTKFEIEIISKNEEVLE